MIEALVRAVREVERRLERLEAQERYGGWVDWTPTVNQGGAVACTVVEAKYCLIGKVCCVQAKIGITGSGVAGNSIQISGQPTVIQPALASGYQPIGVCFALDAGVNVYFGSLIAFSGISWSLTCDTTGGFVGENPNFALANGDGIQFTALYRVG